MRMKKQFIHEGTVLPNGAEVLDVTWRSEHEGVVLGKYMKNSREEFAVWRIYLTEQGEIETFWGHYANDMELAWLVYGGVVTNHPSMQSGR